MASGHAWRRVVDERFCGDVVRKAALVWLSEVE
jgi:hypothetical protein